MGLVMATTLYFVQHENLERQYEGLRYIVRKIAADASAQGGSLPQDPALGEYLDRLKVAAELPSHRSILLLFNQDGEVVQQYPSELTEEGRQMLERWQELPKLQETIVQMALHGEREPYLVAIHPLGNSSIAGHAVYMMPRENLLRGLIEFRLVRVFSVLTLILAGWGVIYLLTKGLVRPIRKTADAAKQIVAGNYQIQFDNEPIKIKEVYELTNAMEEMAERLERLESMRNQLLAGVTHELKTPIASISGLIQAVKDGIVDGEDGKIFLNNALKQTQRLQKMVEDLLDFHYFASQTVTVQKLPVDLHALVEGIVERWIYSCDEPLPKVTISVSERLKSPVCTDPERVEQIIVNLLNNADDAISEDGEIQVAVTVENSQCQIAVCDNGHGIATDQQENIFTPFYRGEEKKRRTHGLGLGLPFSRLIARSLGGDLLLQQSGPQGTIFVLTIPYHE